MAVKKTKEQLIKEISVKNANIELVGEYLNTNTPTQFRCKIHDYLFMMRPADLLRGQNCPKCSKRYQRTHEEFIEEMRNINPNIQILSEYKKVAIKVKCRCKVDGHEWEATPNGLLGGSGCIICAGIKQKTHDEFIVEMKEKHPTIEILNEYINAKTYIRCRCKIDGYEWSAKASNLVTGYACPMCYGNIKKTHEQFVQELSQVNKNIEVLDEYTTNKDKLRFRCKIDGYIWITTGDSVLRGHGCSVCNESKGEKFIRNFLTNNKILFIPQKEFDGLYGLRGGNLSYDFYLPEYNLLIEYQGEFHYGVAKKQTEEDIKTQKEHDERKRNYAMNNNIKLLEIPYWEFKNIEQILNKELGVLKQVV